VRPKQQTFIPLDRSLVTLSLKAKNCLIWRPNENGLTDVGFAGVIEHPAWAKLTPVRKLGVPRESKYALRSGISIASTARISLWDKNEITDNKFYGTKKGEVKTWLSANSIATKLLCLSGIGLCISLFWANQTDTVVLHCTLQCPTTKPFDALSK